MNITLRNQPIAYNTQETFYQQVQQGTWEPFTFDAIDRFYEPGKVFLDIGAWNGIFSVYASKKGAVCYAFEPDPVAFELAMHSLLLNELYIMLSCFAISSKPGIATLNNQSQGFGNSESSLVNRGTIGRSTEVTTTTIEEVMKVHDINPADIFLIKMDIEGGEIDVLRSARAWITQHTPNMHISYHPSWIKSYDDVMYLFDIYDVVSDKGTTVTKDNFEAVLAAHEHAFVYTKK